METSAKFKIGFFHGVRNCALCIVHRALPFQGAAAPRAGMALVVVLGLISLLLVSSVTFAIMMRVERASSANARNTIMARQAAKSALAYAIRDIDHYLETSPTNEPLWRRSSNPNSPSWETSSHPDWTFRKENSAATARKVTFWKDTFGSIDHSINNQTEENRAIARVMGHQLQDYLPFAIRHRAYAQSLGKYSGENPIAPEWVPMTIVKEDDKEAGEYAYDVVGRCAYLALNTSGYLEIPSLCREGKATRRYGASPAEIQPVGEFLKKGEGDDLKEDNKGMDYATVAEIIRAKANKNASPKDNKLNATVFADGAAFSAFNFAPVGRMPTNEIPSGSSDYKEEKNLYEKVYGNSNPFPFVGRICIAGDGSQNHLDSLRRHKAAIITAFKLAGLTQSSSGFEHKDIKDEKCDDKECTVCGGTASSYTLKKDDIPEQALWAYLGLIDYIDDNDFPEPGDGRSQLDDDEEYEAFARPTTENAPLLNGFLATFRIFREETFTNMTFSLGYDADGNEIKSKELPVFDGDHAIYGVEFNGMVAFTSRNAAKADESTWDDIQETEIQAKMGFRLEGYPWDTGNYDEEKGTTQNTWGNFVGSAKNLSFDDDGIEWDEEAGGTDGIVFMSKAGDRPFGGEPVLFFPKEGETITSKVTLCGTISDPTNEEEKNKVFEYRKTKRRVEEVGDFPEYIYVGAAGRAFIGDGGDHDGDIHRVPALSGVYDSGDPASWLMSCYSRDHEFNDLKDEKGDDEADKHVFRKGYCCEENTGKTVFKTKDVAEVAARANPNGASPSGGSAYTLQRRVVNVIMWAEMIDPAFSCGSTAESFNVEDGYLPRTFAASHNPGGAGSSWGFFATANPKGVIDGFDTHEVAKEFFKEVRAATKRDSGGNDKFKGFVEDFRDQDMEHPYFITDSSDDRAPGYSIFQRFLLADGNGDSGNPCGILPGVRDGKYRRKDADGNATEHTDDFFQQFCSLHVRNGDRYGVKGKGLESVGELGFLPIGPYATIRLFGFTGEGPQDGSFDGYGLQIADDDSTKAISTFNVVPYRHGSTLYDRPFHRVLDFFCVTNGPTRGLINVNGGDRLAIASAFNGAPVDDFLYDAIKEGDALDEDSASTLFAPAFTDAYKGGRVVHLSNIGWLYDTGDDDLYEDIDNYFSDLTGNRKNSPLNSNNAREAVIRNTCGLFTDRGLNFSILLRGEAFTPFLGRSDVRSEKGTTLASRSAFAQLWRDTEPDEDGNYPYFIQYFKIFDE